MRNLLPLALVLALPIGMQAQTTDWCVPSAPVKAALEQLPATAPSQTDLSYEQEHTAVLRNLLVRFPGDLFVQRAYIESIYRTADTDKLIAEYKVRYDRAPDDPVTAYLYATTLEGRQSAQAIKILESVLAKSPQFPWPHYALASLYGTPVFLNKDERVKHAKALLDACPASLDAYGQLSGLDDPKLLTPAAARLRALLQTRTDMDAIRAYPMLWSAEFKAHPMSEYDGLRKQVAGDLQRLRALNLENKRGWYYTLEKGYELIKDQPQADWASDQRNGRWEPWAPASALKWYRDHPRPSKDDPEEKRRTYYAEMLKQADEWAKERQNTTFIWQARFYAMDELADVPADNVESVADQYLKHLIADAGPDGPASNDYFAIAKALSKKHLQPERVLELARKGLARAEVESAEPSYDTYDTKENLAESHFYQSLDPITGSGLQAESHIQLKDAEKARLALGRMEDALHAADTLADDKPEMRKEYTRRSAAWWGLMARTAELQHHDQDAMAFYEHALLTRLEARNMPAPGEPDEVADNARRLFTKLGGTNSGWQIWYGSRADTLATQATLTWEDANEPLPAFELVDLKGKTWTQDSLKGKVTFLNFWASW